MDCFVEIVALEVENLSLPKPSVCTANASPSITAFSAIFDDLRRRVWLRSRISVDLIRVTRDATPEPCSEQRPMAEMVCAFLRATRIPSFRLAMYTDVFRNHTSRQVRWCDDDAAELDWIGM